MFDKSPQTENNILFANARTSLSRAQLRRYLQGRLKHILHFTRLTSLSSTIMSGTMRIPFTFMDAHSAAHA